MELPPTSTNQLRTQMRTQITKAFVEAKLEEVQKQLKSDFFACRGDPNTTDGIMPCTLCLFMAVELLGRLSGKGLVGFLTDYLGRIRPTYAQFPTVLEAMFRDSLAHRYEPGYIVIEVEGKRVAVTWEITKQDEHRRKEHLLLKNVPTHFFLLAKGCKEHRVISIHLAQFYEDIISAIDVFKHDVFSSEEWLKKVLNRVEDLFNPVNIDNRRKSIPASEIAYLESQFKHSN